MTEQKILTRFGAGLLVVSLSACAGGRPSGGNSGMSFGELDADGDEKISLAEFVEKAPFMRRDPEEIFQMLDKDEDGYINQKEFDARSKGRGRPQ
jgi:Ca2+-binding EF-hand superfamily protein